MQRLINRIEEHKIIVFIFLSILTFVMHGVSTWQYLVYNVDVYFKVISGKTSSLFSAACQVGGISADASLKEKEALKSFGTNFGMAFQLIDDAIDYSSTYLLFLHHPTYRLNVYTSVMIVRTCSPFSKISAMFTYSVSL